MKKLRKNNPYIFYQLLLFGLLDLAFGFGLVLLPETVFVQTQNYVVGALGKTILGDVLIFKGVAILIISLRAKRVRTLKILMGIGLVLWSILAITAAVGMIRGVGTSWFGFSLCLFIALSRAALIHYTPKGVA